MKISTARDIMLSKKEMLVQRQNEVAIQQVSNPSVRLHAGPQLRYNEACQRFVVLHLEQIFLRKQRLLLVNSATTNTDKSFQVQDEISATRIVLNRNKRLLNDAQMRYDESRRRFATIHLRQRSLRMKIKEDNSSALLPTAEPTSIPSDGQSVQ